jgi:hypothetical protein
MANLSDNQLEWLRSQHIPLSSMFDATGMTKTERELAMKADGKSFCYGVAPCQAGRHTIKTRAGHCPQCDHARVAYMLRHDAQANVYIAGSCEGRFIKIGCSGDISDRRKKLNEYQYGGQRDWQILAVAACNASGMVESQAHAKLARFNVPGEYVRAGKRQRCYELLRCDFSDAKAAVTSFLAKGEILRIPDEARATQAFAFRE